ncbi:hypothetical protein J3F84DRAFT_379881 [Trichoderma pleuroticola]
MSESKSAPKTMRSNHGRVLLVRLRFWMPCRAMPCTPQYTVCQYYARCALEVSATCCRQQMHGRRQERPLLAALNRHLLPASCSSGHLDGSQPTNLTPLRRPDSRRHATPQMTREDEQGQEAASPTAPAGDPRAWGLTRGPG